MVQTMKFLIVKPFEPKLSTMILKLTPDLQIVRHSSTGLSEALTGYMATPTQSSRLY